MITSKQYEEICKNYFDTTGDYEYIIANNTEQIVIVDYSGSESYAWVYSNWANCFYNFEIVNCVIEDIENIGINDTIEWLGARNFVDIYKQWLPFYKYISDNLEDTDEQHYIDYLECWFDTHDEGCPVCFNEWCDNEKNVLNNGDNND